MTGDIRGFRNAIPSGERTSKMVGICDDASKHDKFTAVTQIAKVGI